MTHNGTDRALVENLRKMVDCCKEIQELLKEDQNYFIDNNLKSVDESNIKKVALLNDLNLLAAEATRLAQSAGPVAKMQHNADSFSPSTTHLEINSAMQELQSEAAKSHKFVSHNSGIVSKNLGQIKNLWDKLVSYKSDENCVYNSKGSVK